MSEQNLVAEKCQRGMLRRGWKRRLLGAAGALLVALTGSAAVASPTWAAQPPAGYPTSQVMATAANPVLGNIQIRRGFYDADINQGWGLDKAWNKHNIWSTEAMRRVMLSPNITTQGLQYLLRAYAGKYQCSGNTCTLSDQREVRGVYDTQTYNNYYGWPVGGQMGMLTMYCYQGGEALCPSWVTYSIINPGVNNPYRIAPSAGVHLSQAESTQQAAILSSDEIRTLKSAIVAGDEQLRFSYEPLPAQINAK